MAFIDYYELLQVSPKAHIEIIKSAYRTMMIKLNNHPDKGGDENTAKLLNEAIEVLSNSNKRMKYDEIYFAHFNSGANGLSNSKELVNIFTLYGHNTPIANISVGFDGRVLASFSEKGNAEKGFLGAIFGASFSCELKIWDLFSGREVINYLFTGDYWEQEFFGGLNLFRLSNSNRYIAIGTDKELKIFNYDNLDNIYSIDGGTIQGIDFDPNLTLMALGIATGIEIYDIYKGESFAIFNMSNQPDIICMDKYSQIVASHIHGEGLIHLWDISQKKKIRSLPCSQYKYQLLLCINSKKGLLAISNTIKISLWNIFNGNLVKELFYPNTAINFSNNDDMLCIGDSNGVVRVVELSNYEEVKLSQAHNHKITQISFDSNDTRIITGSEDKSIKVWGVK